MSWRPPATDGAAGSSGGGLPPKKPWGAFWYWTLVGVIASFVVLGAFTPISPAAGFLAVALTLARLLRARRALSWAILAAPLGLAAAFFLVAPLSCSGTTSSAGSSNGSEPAVISRTACSNLIGIRYEGAGTYNPPLTPALLAGLGGAAVAATGAVLLAHRYRGDSIGARD